MSSFAHAIKIKVIQDTYTSWKKLDLKCANSVWSFENESNHEKFVLVYFVRFRQRLIMKNKF